MQRSTMRLARAGRGRNSQVATDLPREREVDLAMTRHGRRALSVEAPEAVVATLAKQPRAVGAKVALQIAAFHPPITSSSGSLSAAVAPECSPKRSSSTAAQRIDHVLARFLASLPLAMNSRALRGPRQRPSHPRRARRRSSAEETRSPLKRYRTLRFEKSRESPPLASTVQTIGVTVPSDRGCSQKGARRTQA